jgi:hypothetical protein
MDPNEPSPDLPAMTPDPSAESPKRSGQSRNQWIAAGIGTVVVAGAAFLGMQAMKSDSSGSSTTTDSNASAASAPDAAQRPAGAPGTRGTITSIDDSTLTVETDDGDRVTVTTDSETTVTKTEDGSVSDIAVGDNLLVMGTSSGSQTAAETIVDSGSEALGGGFRGGPSGNRELPDRGQLPDGGQPPNGGSFTPPVVGSVTSIDNGTITLETAAGETVTVTTSSSTEFTVRRSAQVSDLAEGDTVLVVGETSGNQVAATAISEGAGGGFGPGGGGFPGAPPGGSRGNGSGDTST